MTDTAPNLDRRLRPSALRRIGFAFIAIILATPIVLIASYLTERAVRPKLRPLFPTDFKSVCWCDGSIWLGMPARGAIAQLDLNGRELSVIQLPFDSDAALWEENGQLFVGSYRIRKRYIVNTRATGAAIVEAGDFDPDRRALQEWRGDQGHLVLRGQSYFQTLSGEVIGRTVNLDLGLASQFHRLSTPAKGVLVAGFLLVPIALFSLARDRSGNAVYKHSRSHHESPDTGAGRDKSAG